MTKCVSVIPNCVTLLTLKLPAVPTHTAERELPATDVSTTSVVVTFLRFMRPRAKYLTLRGKAVSSPRIVRTQ